VKGGRGSEERDDLGILCFLGVEMNADKFGIEGFSVAGSCHKKLSSAVINS
jgi:hypothetical protein